MFDPRYRAEVGDVPDAELAIGNARRVLQNDQVAGLRLGYVTRDKAQGQGQ